jgi:cell division septum initiation protein DivIVA
VTAGRLDFAEAGRGAAAATVPDGRIETPYLQLVMQRLWQAERGAGSSTLRAATLRELGGAEQIVRDAQAHAQALQQEAKKSLSEAHVNAQQIARDAQAKADAVRKQAEEILADAQTKAEETAKLAQTNADELKHQAQQRYEDVVGGLAAKREALQRQIEALEVFDRDYRARITNFLQNQLRSLWVDEPKLSADLIEGAAPASAAKPGPVAGQKPAGPDPDKADKADRR